LNSRDPKSISNQPILTFGSRGSNDGQFNASRAICVNSKGEIIVADSDNHRIQIFDKDGKFIRKFGSEGLRTGLFNLPVGVSVDQQDHIYVSDYHNHLIQIFDQDGSIHLQTIG